MQVHAVVVMAATKLLGRLPPHHSDALKAIVVGCRHAHNVEVQQRSCEVSEVLKLKTTLPVLTPAFRPIKWLRLPRNFQLSSCSSGGL